MQRLLVSAFGILLTIFSTAPAAAQSRDAVLAGRVVSATGKALAGIEVVAQSAQGIASTAVADATGRFDFRPLEPGDYRISARAIGFSSVVERVSVSAGESIDLTLVLPEIVRERVNVVGEASAIDRIPGSATIIDRQEMERVKLATDDVHQMLRQVPGLNIQEEE
jgi:hypothetical protein